MAERPSRKNTFIDRKALSSVSGLVHDLAATDRRALRLGESFSRDEVGLTVHSARRRIGQVTERGDNLADGTMRFAWVDKSADSIFAKITGLAGLRAWVDFTKEHEIVNDGDVVTEPTTVAFLSGTVRIFEERTGEGYVSQVAYGYTNAKNETDTFEFADFAGRLGFREQWLDIQEQSQAHGGLEIILDEKMGRLEVSLFAGALTVLRDNGI